MSKVEIVGNTMGFRSIWTLNDVTKEKAENGRPVLKVRYYAYIIAHGRYPVWAIYTAEGKFVRYASSKTMVEQAYPKLAMRRVMAGWAMTSLENHSIDKRLHQFAETTGKRVPDAIRPKQEG